MSSIIDRFVGYLLQRDIIELSKIEQSFFLYKKLDKKLKLSQEIILLNYLKESPYPSNETEITAIVDKDRLYLWFNRATKGYYLPEALLLFRQLSFEYSNVIFIIKGEIDKVVVIKDSVLVASFAKKTISDGDIALIKDEYFLDTIVVLDEKNYSTFLKNAFKFLKFSDIFHILNIKFDIKALFNRGVLVSALPIFITSIVLVVVVLGYSLYLKDGTQKLYKRYKKSQLLTVDIKEKINRNENLNEVFNALSDEFKYEDKVMALSEIIRNSDELNMTMFYINSYENNIDFIVKTEDSNKIPIYTKRLFETKLFSDVKNISSQKTRANEIKATMSAKLEERK